ncbi:MAG: LCP family protein [Erysipelotrichaceae bacterium]
MNKQKSRSRKRKKRVRFDRLFLVVLVGTIAVYGFVRIGAYAAGHALQAMAQNRNVVILGVDGREATEFTSRADAIMIANVDADHSSVSLYSVPRDTYVELACSSRFDKITNGYAYGEVNWVNQGGGKACVVETLGNFFELPSLQAYVEVDFEKFIRLIDGIGGITLTPTISFAETTEDNQLVTFNEGVDITVNGDQALVYARHRKSDNDLFRAGRQQQILFAMAKRVQELSLIDQIQFGLKALSSVDTNLSLFDLAPYVGLLQGDLQLQSEVLQGSDAYYFNEDYQDYSYYLEADAQSLAQIQEQLRFGK